MRTSILLAAAAAALALAGTVPSAVAQMYPMATPQSGKASSPGIKTAKKPVAKGYLPRSAAKGPGRCGTHMYWKGGKCHDARSPGGK
jgi:hypothetical protein